MSINLEEMERLAKEATAQNLASAEHQDEDAMPCPVCDGEGDVESVNYTNYDGAPLGVQFFGIGEEHVAAEKYFRALKPATILALVRAVRAADKLFNVPHAEFDNAMHELNEALQPFTTENRP